MLRKRALTHRFQPEYENNGAFTEWAEQVGQSIAVNTGEYLTEEKQLLAVRSRIDRFIIAVNQLQIDTEQLAWRVDSLENVERKGG